MSIKLFVTDMDGTLLNSSQRISEENKQAIKEATAAGVTVTIATGRMYASALPYAKELGVDVPIITYDGALIKSVAGEVLHSSYLPEDIVRDVLNFAFARGWHIQLYSDDELYFVEKSPYTDVYEHKAGVKGHFVGREGLYSHLANVPKLLSIAETPEEITGRVQELGEAFGEKISAARSNPTYVDITNRGINKAAAIKILAAKLGIKTEEIMAIGDSNNDLSMMKAAGKSVAMGNAREEIKAACDYVTATCDESGVAEAIRRYVLK